MPDIIDRRIYTQTSSVKEPVMPHAYDVANGCKMVEIISLACKLLLCNLNEVEKHMAVNHT